MFEKKEIVILSEAKDLGAVHNKNK